jgi:hypothetical protein
MSGDTSGGHFAVGRYAAPGRALELHTRYALGIVNYLVRDQSIEHSRLMEALGVRADAAYPGYSDDPLDGFRHLRADLERFGRGFVTGRDCEALAALAGKVTEEPRRRVLP